MTSTTNTTFAAASTKPSNIDLKDRVLADLCERRMVTSIEMMSAAISEFAGFDMLVQTTDGKTVAIATDTVQGEDAPAQAVRQAEVRIDHVSNEILPNLATHIAVFVFDREQESAGPCLRHLAISVIGDGR